MAHLGGSAQHKTHSVMRQMVARLPLVLALVCISDCMVTVQSSPEHESITRYLIGSM